MYKVLKLTCCAMVHTIRSFVFPCPRCRRRRGLLKVPIHWSSDSVRSSNSNVLHSMIKVIDLPYNTRDKLTSFYLGK